MHEKKIFPINNKIFGAFMSTDCIRGDDDVIVLAVWQQYGDVVHFPSAFYCFLFCYLCGLMFKLSFLVTFALKYGYFPSCWLSLPCPSRWNSCPNTLSEGGCVLRNHSWANERRRPAHAVTVVYYRSSALIGGNVGENQALCCVQRHRKKRSYSEVQLLKR